MEIREILKSPGLVIVDLRQPNEFKKEHIQDSINIPMEEIPARVEEIKEVVETIGIVLRNREGLSQRPHIYLSQHGLLNTYAGGSWLELNILKGKGN